MNWKQDGEGVHRKLLSFLLPGQMMTPDEADLVGVSIRRIPRNHDPAGETGAQLRLERCLMEQPHSTQDQLLNATQRKHLLVTLKHADSMLLEIERVLDSSETRSLL